MHPRADAWSTAGVRPEARADFLHRTYQHLALAIGAFIGLEALLLELPGIEGILRTALAGRFSWLIVLGAFMVVSWVAQSWARSSASRGLQYLGLSLYVVAEAIIFLPLLYMAAFMTRDPSVIPTAGLITGVTFGGLTATVLISKRDFSFLGGILRVASFGALGLIVAGIVFGFSLGVFAAFALALFAAGSIVYETSNVLHHYRSDQHVAAALALFASVALLFWYVLRIVMSLSDRD